MSKAGLCLPLFLILFIYLLTISVIPNISTSTRPIVARFSELVDDHTEVIFAIRQGTLPWQPIFAGFSHRTGFLSFGDICQMAVAYGKK